MRESDFQSLFGRYLKSHPPNQTEAYELKICKGNTPLYFSALQSHQEAALLQAETNSGLFHRITDQPWLPNRKYTFTAKKPFDCLCLVKVKSFVVVWFYKPRQKKIAYKIPIKAFLDESVSSKRKSLTEQRAAEIGQAIIMT